MPFMVMVGELSADRMSISTSFWTGTDALHRAPPVSGEPR